MFLAAFLMRPHRPSGAARPEILELHPAPRRPTARRGISAASGAIIINLKGLAGRGRSAWALSKPFR
jgi:hypothetical protein